MTNISDRERIARALTPVPGMEPVAYQYELADKVLGALAAKDEPIIDKVKDYHEATPAHGAHCYSNDEPGLICGWPEMHPEQNALRCFPLHSEGCRDHGHDGECFPDDDGGPVIIIEPVGY